jgi:mannose-6-phosphate isomerase
MSAPTQPVFKLAPGIQSYAWGKRGGASLAAQLASKSIPGFEVDEDKTYAEVSAGMRVPAVRVAEGPWAVL